MLVNIQFKYIGKKDRELLDSLSGDSNDIKNPFAGVYIITHHNFGWYIANRVKGYPVNQ